MRFFLLVYYYQVTKGLEMGEVALL